MSCEKTREQLTDLIPQLADGTDDRNDAVKARNYLVKECTQQPNSHTSAILMSKSFAERSKEDQYRELQSVLIVCKRLGRKVLIRKGVTQEDD